MRWRFAALAALWGLVSTFSASATSLVRMSVEQLTQASAAIVRGRAVAQLSHWNAAHTQIVTLTTVAVEATLKGSAPASVLIQQPGGTVGRIRTFVPGTVRFYPQAQYVLFLEPAEPGSSHYLLVGMMQGSYRLFRDPKTGQERVINPMGGFFFSNRAGGGAPALPQTIPLSQFQKQVSSAAEAPIAIPSGTALPMVVRSVKFDGVGRLLLEGRITADLFPNRHLVIPAGSRVEGYATRRADQEWIVRWTSVSIRGREARISTARDSLPASGLRGQQVTAIVR